MTRIILHANCTLRSPEVQKLIHSIRSIGLQCDVYSDGIVAPVELWVNQAHLSHLLPLIQGACLISEIQENISLGF